ncbi:MAG: replication-associated recombination protein A [Candidatus Pacebacteria bacterium]|nr:replication-associated recombination protein A [Candidatus Paceibacterota bacterium]
MEDLFNNKNFEKPLAEKMRPVCFEDFFGQEEICGKNSPLRKLIEKDEISSLILWGPPGSGKTTLAYIIAKKTKAYFKKFEAATTGVAQVKTEIEKAQERRKYDNKKTIIFIDEIHRFNKAQQDILLSSVEQGIIILIGATTENPSFGIISPLLSRSIVYSFKSLLEKDLEKIIKRALKELKKEITDKALKRLINYANGDARIALNGLEFAVKSLNKKILEEKDIETVLKKHALRYDKKGEEHYNLISAFIKSMRDSDPSAALYWSSRIIESGEDPRFIARRMIIFASEDIGLADPKALLVANAVAQAVEFVGLPEAEINLAHGICYLSLTKKNNISYKALLEAKQDVTKGSFPVPLHLRNAVTDFLKQRGYGKDYKYAHDFKGEIKQKHFPEEIGEQKYL